MTKDEFKLQNKRIEKARELTYKIENRNTFCQATETKMDKIEQLDVIFSNKDTVTITSIREYGEIAREFAKIATKFFKKKAANAEAEYNSL